MYVKASIVKVNKCPKPFFLEQHINIANTVTRFKAFGRSVAYGTALKPGVYDIFYINNTTENVMCIILINNKILPIVGNLTFISWICTKLILNLFSVI